MSVLHMVGFRTVLRQPAAPKGRNAYMTDVTKHNNLRAAHRNAWAFSLRSGEMPEEAFGRRIVPADDEGPIRKLRPPLPECSMRRVVLCPRKRINRGLESGCIQH